MKSRFFGLPRPIAAFFLLASFGARHYKAEKSARQSVTNHQRQRSLGGSNISIANWIGAVFTQSEAVSRNCAKLSIYKVYEQSSGSGCGYPNKLRRGGYSTRDCHK